LHIYVTILLAIESRRARPEPYIDRQYVKASWASRYMVVSGLGRARVHHLSPAHFTGANQSQFPLLKNSTTLNRYDVYSMMVYGFQNVYVSTFYVVGLFLLTSISLRLIEFFFQSLA